MKYSGYRNTDASILVYKFRPKRTGFNMYAEYTQLQLTFLALVPCTVLFNLYFYLYFLEVIGKILIAILPESLQPLYYCENSNQIS